MEPNQLNSKIEWLDSITSTQKLDPAYRALLARRLEEARIEATLPEGTLFPNLVANKIARMSTIKCVEVA